MSKTPKLAKAGTGGKKKTAPAPKKKSAAPPPAPPTPARPTLAQPTLAPSNGGPGAEILDRLWTTVLSRRGSDPSLSHSARLLSRGTVKVAQKFGEEAVECLIEAVANNPSAVVAESADVLYHLIVLWVAAGVEPGEVWTELHRRGGMSGVAEKASRGLNTKKIP